MEIDRYVTEEAHTVSSSNKYNICKDIFITYFIRLNLDTLTKQTKQTIC